MKNTMRFWALVALSCVGSTQMLHATDIGNQSLNSYFNAQSQLQQSEPTEKQSARSSPYHWVNDLIEHNISSKMDKRFTFSLNALNHQQQYLLQQMNPETTEVSDFVLLTQGGRFKCILEDRSTSPSRETELSGRLIIYHEVPVLIRPIGVGETIQDEDITLKEVPENQLMGGVIVEKEALIGTQPKSGRLLSGRPIRSHQVTHELLLRKGALVTLTYKTTNMVLQAKGRSLDNGTLGSVVRVTNIDSNQMLEGIITSPNEVTISSPEAELLQELG